MPSARRIQSRKVFSFFSLWATPSTWRYAALVGRLADFAAAPEAALAAENVAEIQAAVSATARSAGVGSAPKAARKRRSSSR